MDACNSNFERLNGWYNGNVKSPEEFGLLVKSVSETIKNKPKEQKVYVIRYISCKFMGKFVYGQPKEPGRRVIRAGEETFRAAEVTIGIDQDF